MLKDLLNIFLDGALVGADHHGVFGGIGKKADRRIDRAGQRHLEGDAGVDLPFVAQPLIDPVGLDRFPGVGEVERGIGDAGFQPVSAARRLHQLRVMARRTLHLVRRHHTDRVQVRVPGIGQMGEAPGSSSCGARSRRRAAQRRGGPSDPAQVSSTSSTVSTGTLPTSSTFPVLDDIPTPMKAFASTGPSVDNAAEMVPLRLLRRFRRVDRPLLLAGGADAVEDNPRLGA